MTITKALDVSQRSVSYREAEIFLQHVLGQTRAWIHAHCETTLTPEEQTAYELCLTRREANEPVSYITEVKEFYGRPFHCDTRALIPRPETEGLIDLALSFLPSLFTTNLKESGKPCPVRILELGTGVGNIAVTLGIELALRTTPAQILATDIVPEALEIARENWDSLAPIDIPVPQFIQADLFNHPKIAQMAPYDLIVANLPYVPSTWQFDPLAQPEVVFHEPDIALFGGEDGLDHYRHFFAEVQHYLASHGRIIIEHNEDQSEALHALVAKELPNCTATTHQDYAELDRILEIR
jgi:release factor glutamine methyltransferase